MTDVPRKEGAGKSQSMRSNGGSHAQDSVNVKKKGGTSLGKKKKKRPFYGRSRESKGIPVPESRRERPRRCQTRKSVQTHATFESARVNERKTSKTPGFY